MNKDKNGADLSATEDEGPFSSYEFEGKPMLDKDAMGREIFWEDIGRP